MNGIEHETIEFHKALIKQLQQINETLRDIQKELEFRNSTIKV